MKKYLSIILVILAVLSMTSSCSKSDNNADVLPDTIIETTNVNENGNVDSSTDEIEYKKKNQDDFSIEMIEKLNKILTLKGEEIEKEYTLELLYIEHGGSPVFNIKELEGVSVVFSVPLEQEEKENVSAIVPDCIRIENDSIILENGISVGVNSGYTKAIDILWTNATYEITSYKYITTLEDDVYKYDFIWSIDEKDFVYWTNTFDGDAIDNDYEKLLEPYTNSVVGEIKTICISVK